MRWSRFATAAVPLFTAVSSACHDRPPPDEAPPALAAATSSAELFSLGVLPRFDLYLDEAAIAALHTEDESILKTWRPGTFRYQDLVWENVGVRLKGNLTLTTLADKPSFKIKFNRYVKGRRFLGLEGLTLNNMYSDPSMLREHLSYKVFRDLGLPASRTGFAELYVNDEPYGLYLNLETLDDEFLTFHFDDPTGNLYEGEHGDDLDGDIWSYEHDEGDDTSRDDLAALHELATDESFDLLYDPVTPLDTPRALDFVLAESFVGQFDGYSAAHNYFLYHEPARDKWTLLPWSLDQTLIRDTDPFGHDSYIGRTCRRRTDCLVDYVQRGLIASDLIAEMRLEDEIDRVLNLIEYAARHDPRKRHSNDAMASAQIKTVSWVAERPERFSGAIDCIVNGTEPDLDGDGFGSCFADCDDHNANIHPQAEEVCDGLDNDCSGFADDTPECPCPREEVLGRGFHFCLHEFTWTKARAFCQQQGLELARLDSRAQSDAVWAIARDLRTSSWAIGLNDRLQENDYRWIDQSVPSFFAWADGEPAHLLDWFDCVFYSGGSHATWRERNCGASAPFVCSDTR
ncbi:MAG: hypothetical protein B7733_26440 [Myxococcales bacterium FL481]|nr:MAG: hypothetical protein B7733_26440 [Myxococcales bacterium FL481]